MFSLARVGKPVQTAQKWKLEPFHQEGLDGSGVNIVILDTDVYNQYPPIARKTPGTVLICPEDFIHDEAVNVNLTHGTLVVTIAAGAKCEDLKFTGGVAPAATVLVCRVSHDSKVYQLQSIYSALQYLVEKKNPVDIISMSVGCEKICVKTAKCIEDLVNRGVVCVAGAGNDGLYQSSVMFPASDKNVISVGSYQPEGDQSKFNPDDNIDVYAPGEDLGFREPNGNLFRVQGTSLATPAIAGLIALLIQQVRKLNDPELEKNMRDVNVLRKILANDLKARGKNLLAPSELLEDGPEKLEKVIKKYIL